MKRSLTVQRRASGLLAALLLVILWDLPAQAAFEIAWPDARSAGMLTRGMLLADSPFEPHRKPHDSTAAPRLYRDLRVTVSGGELYGVREASGWAARAQAASGPATITVELSRLGGGLYKERSAHLGVAFAAAPDLSVAARLRGLGIAARGLDDRWTGAFDASVTKRLIGRVLIGAAGENLTRSRIGDSPVTARTGFGAALVLPSVSLQLSLQLEEAFAPSTVVSAEVALTDRLRVRIGAADTPRKLGFGVGVGRESSSWPVVDIAGQWHPELGVSTFVSITVAP